MITAFFSSDQDGNALLMIKTAARPKPKSGGTKENRQTNTPKPPREFKTSLHRREYMRDLMRRKRAKAQ
jgi:hypothetical protein